MGSHRGRRSSRARPTGSGARSGGASVRGRAAAQSSARIQDGAREQAWMASCKAGGCGGGAATPGALWSANIHQAGYIHTPPSRRAAWRPPPPRPSRPSTRHGCTGKKRRTPRCTPLPPPTATPSTPRGAAGPPARRRPAGRADATLLQMLARVAATAGALQSAPRAPTPPHPLPQGVYRPCAYRAHPRGPVNFNPPHPSPHRLPAPPLTQHTTALPGLLCTGRPHAVRARVPAFRHAHTRLSPPPSTRATVR